MKTADEIIKAIEVCLNPEISTCRGCPYNHDDGEFRHCGDLFAVDTINIIRQQQARIEQLTKENKALLIDSKMFAYKGGKNDND